MPLYPLFLKLEGERCLVVGAGEIGAQKAEGLLAAGAALHVVAPEVGPRMERAIENAASPCVVDRRPFVPEDCEGARLVISATGDPSVDAVVYDAAKAAHALVNVVDVKERCDFYAGSVVQQGPLSILIGTEGKSPSVARYTRQLLERELPPSLGALADALGARRPDLLAAIPDFADRARIMNAFVHRAAPRLRPNIDPREIDAWIVAELLREGSASDAPYLLCLTLDVTADDADAITTIEIAGRHFSRGSVEADVLSEGDASFIADQVRALLRDANALDGASVVWVRAHGIEIGAGDGTRCVLDGGTSERAAIVDLVAPLCTLD